LYGAGAFGELAVNRTTGPASSSLASSRRAAFVLIALTLALAGCGRKGALDLPPNAMAAQPTSSAPGSVDAEAEAAANRGTVFDPSFGADRAPAATKGKKKPFILDPILD
jgi:predicted small lipoprotein YifL